MTLAQLQALAAVVELGSLTAAADRLSRSQSAISHALTELEDITQVKLLWRDRQPENSASGRNVVNVSSLSGSRVYPHQGQAVYAASKAALTHLTRHLGAEFAQYGVRVNAVAPNSFPTLVSTEAVADAIVRLDREPVTGQVLALQGAPADPAR